MQRSVPSSKRVPGSALRREPDAARGARRRRGRAEIIEVTWFLMAPIGGLSAHCPLPCTVNVSGAHSAPGAGERIGDAEAIVGKSAVFCLRGNFPTVMLTAQDRGQVLSWPLLPESAQLVNPTDFREESE